jgi:hypothetical protein
MAILIVQIRDMEHGGLVAGGVDIPVWTESI